MLAAASLTLSDVALLEGNDGTHSTVAIVSLSAPKKYAVTVKYNTAHGTALAGSDFRAVSGKLTFAPGQTSKSIRVPVIGDRLVESDETFFIKLHDATRAKIADGRGVVTIMDDEPRLNISDVQAMEGSSGPTPFAFTVSLSAAYDLPVTVNYTTSDGSATAGSDYTAASGTLVFAPGETSKTIPVVVTGNRTPGPDKTFSVGVSTPNSYAAISNGVAVGTIIDGEPRISIADAYNSDGATSFTFTVSLSAAYDQDVMVNFATADGTAIAGVDYVATSGTLTFAPGEMTKTITVDVLDTTAADKSFSVHLSGVSTNALDRKRAGVRLLVLRLRWLRLRWLLRLLRLRLLLLSHCELTALPLFRWASDPAAGESQPRRRTLTGLVASPRRSVCALGTRPFHCIADHKESYRETPQFSS